MIVLETIHQLATLIVIATTIFRIFKTPFRLLLVIGL